MTLKKPFLAFVLGFTLFGAKAQDNLIGVYFSDLVKFPGMGFFFSDETWISGQNQALANRQYTRLGTGIMYQHTFKRDWILSVKAGAGFRNLHEFFDHEYTEYPDASTSITYKMNFDGTYRQNNFTVLPGIYYRIGNNNSRISGYGGMELLFIYYGKGRQEAVEKNQITTTSTFNAADTNSTGSRTVMDDMATNTYNNTFQPGMAAGLGFVAGLKVRVTPKMYLGIDIAEYVSYLRFKGTTVAIANSEYTKTTTLNGIVTNRQQGNTSQKGEFSTTYGQFSFSNLVASLSVSFAF